MTASVPYEKKTELRLVRHEYTGSSLVKVEYVTTLNGIPIECSYFEGLEGGSTEEFKEVLRQLSEAALKPTLIFDEKTSAFFGEEI